MRDFLDNYVLFQKATVKTVGSNTGKAKWKNETENPRGPRTNGNLKRVDVAGKPGSGTEKNKTRSPPEDRHKSSDQ